MISNGTLCVCPKSQQRCAAVYSLAAFVGVYVCLRWSDRGREKGSMVSSENRLLCLIPSCPDLVPVCAVPLPGAHSPWHKGSARVGFVREGVRLAAVLVARAFFVCFRMPLPKRCDSKSAARTLGAEHKAPMERVDLREAPISSVLNLFNPHIHV